MSCKDKEKSGKVKAQSLKQNAVKSFQLLPFAFRLKKPNFAPSKHNTMYNTLKPVLQQELAEIDNAGLYKRERIITSPQGADITVQGGQEVINFCANNYLGLSGNAKVIEAAKQAMDTHGYGLSSVRFICGTQDIHKELE